MTGAAGKSTPVGFEPTRGDPIGLAGRRLNRSAKVSYAHADSQRTLRSEPQARDHAALHGLVRRTSEAKPATYRTPQSRRLGRRSIRGPQATRFARQPPQPAKQKAGCVVWVLQGRGHCIPFRLTFPPLQVAPSSACSVTSLSQSPGH